MVDNQESHESENTPAATPAAGKTTASKKPKTVKKQYGKMTFRLPLDIEHALTLSSVQLARAGDETHTMQQMVDHGMERYTDYLQIRKGVDMLGVVPKKSPAK